MTVINLFLSLYEFFTELVILHYTFIDALQLLKLFCLLPSKGFKNFASDWWWWWWWWCIRLSGIILLSAHFFSLFSGHSGVIRYTKQTVELWTWICLVLDHSYLILAKRKITWGIQTQAKDHWNKQVVIILSLPSFINFSVSKVRWNCKVDVARWQQS